MPRLQTSSPFLEFLKATGGFTKVWLVAFGVSAVFGVKAIVTVETLGNDKTGIDKVDKLVSNISKLGKEGLLTVAALAIGLVGYVDGKLDKMDSKLGSKLDKILEIQHVLLTEKALETSSVQILQKRKEENSKRK
ncbi:hypothetical protein NADE_001583 [Nannochloris sp. 'desiccata']|nr:hypothetical protein KSW81_001560 [Chlorella desiccata (nom. nud.)]KAH7616775.1 hypothetical protein NADE_001583 [Chlorella desiccata (nom. nud.)]